MLEWICIFHRGGTVLFFRDYRQKPGASEIDKLSCSLPEAELSLLARSVLLAEKSGLEATELRKNLLVFWRTANQYKLVFVAGASKRTDPAALGRLLEHCRGRFCQQYGSVLHKTEWTEDHFKGFSKILDQIMEERSGSILRPVANSKALAPATPTTARLGPDEGPYKSPTVAVGTPTSIMASAITGSLDSASKEPTYQGSQADHDESAVSAMSHPHEHRPAPADESPLQSTQQTAPEPVISASDTAGQQKSTRRPRVATKSMTNHRSQKKATKPLGKPATGRRWDDDALTAEELAALDLSNDASKGLDESDAVERARAIYVEARPRGSVFQSETTSAPAADETAPAQADASLAGTVLGMFARLAGSRPLTCADLEQPLQFFRDKLIARNVAPTVAETLTQSVGASLEGRVLDAFTVHRMVRSAMEDALSRVLQPMQGTQDLVDTIKEYRHRNVNGRPFVIVFTGVNGVGKSTTLAKIGFLLQKHGMRLLIAAGDTFRAGAIEQLRIHARCLNAPLFEQGYGKDPATVAASAIAQATAQNDDVVLVDTAGRMQDNEPLMKALAKLVERTEPDRVLFVGEALVGNEAIDQLVKFNRALVTFQQSSSKPRLIDGIVLTKFDTVDEKVGAAITMIYSTSIPIVYVGTGQTYHDLEPVNIPNLVKALLH
jgi:signal recognition particle receptor subunit alpha